jgi:hypothetical protein
MTYIFLAEKILFLANVIAFPAYQLSSWLLDQQPGAGVTLLIMMLLVVITEISVIVLPKCTQHGNRMIFKARFISGSAALAAALIIRVEFFKAYTADKTY